MRQPTGFTQMGLRTLKHRWWAYAFVALQGCATLSQQLVQNVPQDYQLSAGDQEGLIVLSTRFLSVGCPGESKIASAFFTISREGTKRTSDNIWMKSPYVTPDPADPTRQLFVRKLKPGRYTLGDLNYAFTTTEKASTNDRIVMPFNVTAGEIHYLGEVVVTAEDCRTLAVKVNNQRKRDMDLLSTRLTKVPAASVKNQIVTVSKKPAP